MKIEKINLIMNLVSITVIITVYFALFHSIDKKPIISSPVKVQIKPKLTKKQIKHAKKLTKAPTYDYKNLLSLIDRYRKMEKSFYANFNLFINDYLNLKNLKYILDELKKERGYFKKYIRKTKRYRSRSASSRRRDSLRYYFRVLEDSIYETKKMIQRFNLNIKIQAKNHNKSN